MSPSLHAKHYIPRFEVPSSGGCKILGLRSRVQGITHIKSQRLAKHGFYVGDHSLRCFLIHLTYQVVYKATDAMRTSWGEQKDVDVAGVLSPRLLEDQFRVLAIRDKVINLPLASWE